MVSLLIVVAIAVVIVLLLSGLTRFPHVGERRSIRHHQDAMGLLEGLSRANTTTEVVSRRAEVPDPDGTARATPEAGIGGDHLGEEAVEDQPGGPEWERRLAALSASGGPSKTGGGRHRRRSSRRQAPAGTRGAARPQEAEAWPLARPSGGTTGGVLLGSPAGEASPAGPGRGRDAAHVGAGPDQGPVAASPSDPGEDGAEVGGFGGDQVAAASEEPDEEAAGSDVPDQEADRPGRSSWSPALAPTPTVLPPRLLANRDDTGILWIGPVSLEPPPADDVQAAHQEAAHRGAAVGEGLTGGRARQGSSTAAGPSRGDGLPKGEGADDGPSPTASAPGPAVEDPVADVDEGGRGAEGGPEVAAGATGVPEESEVGALEEAQAPGEAGPELTGHDVHGGVQGDAPVAVAGVVPVEGAVGAGEHAAGLVAAEPGSTEEPEAAGGEDEAEPPSGGTTPAPEQRRGAHRRVRTPAGAGRLPVAHKRGLVAAATVLVLAVTGTVTALAVTGTQSSQGQPAGSPVNATLRAVSSSAAGATYRLPPGPAVIAVTTSGRCWVEARAGAGGPVLYEGTLPTGASRSFGATGSLWLRIGNLEALRLAVNGGPVQLPAGASSPYNLTFQPSASPSA